ncbi:MAG: isochorismatase family protein [Hylemonella sp.]
MLLEAADSQLLLLDYQVRLLPAIHEGSLVLANAQRLAQLARLFSVPVLLAEENPASLGGTETQLDTLVRQAGGKTFAKMSFSAVAAGLIELLQPSAPPKSRVQGNARSLPKHLHQPAPATPQRSSVVIAGCEAHVCLLQTALELLEQEFEVWVVTDACGSRSERNRDAAFDRLAAAGAELVSTEMVAFEWLRSADHPALADVLALVK